MLDLSHSIGPRLKLVMNFNSLNIHSVSKITLYVHERKEADLNATDDRGMKPKIWEAAPWFSVVPHLITMLYFDHVKRPLDMLL